jgi:3',5'-cyclic AMP phosphodiesterase CpdA
MKTILHVSDLHFGQSSDQNRKAKALLDAIRRQYPDRHLLVTGDFTESGEQKEYKLAGQALSPFAGRVFVTPGNHDYGSIWTGYSQQKAKYFDDPFAQQLGFKHPFRDKKVFVETLQDPSDQSALMIIGLNSCAKVGAFTAEGEVGHSQMDKLRRILTDCNPLVPKLLFLHHVPYKDLGPGMTLRDWEELMEVVKDKVDVLAFGHQGTVMRPDQRGRSIRLLPAPSRPMRSRRVVVGTKRVWVLDAENSVAEQACYVITSHGTKTNATVQHFGKWRVIRKRQTARADRRHA